MTTANFPVFLIAMTFMLGSSACALDVPDASIAEESLEQSQFSNDEAEQVGSALQKDLVGGVAGTAGGGIAGTYAGAIIGGALGGVLGSLFGGPSGAALGASGGSRLGAIFGAGGGATIGGWFGAKAPGDRKWPQ